MLHQERRSPEVHGLLFLLFTIDTPEQSYYTTPGNGKVIGTLHNLFSSTPPVLDSLAGFFFVVVCRLLNV